MALATAPAQDHVARPSGGLGRFLGFRALSGLGTLLFVLLFNFFLFRLLPGDPAARYRAVGFPTRKSTFRTTRARAF